MTRRPPCSPFPDSATQSVNAAGCRRLRRPPGWRPHDERKASFLLRLLARSGRRLGEASIVFTEYRDTLARLEQRLTAAGHPITVLHGALSPADRRRVQLAFNERGGILLATDAASEGLNLHERCRLVIHYELPWSPSRLEQRAGRVDRFGQARRVHELALVAADTAEALVLAPLFARRGRRTSPGRMLHALTESRVVAAIMMDADPASLVTGVSVAAPECAVGPSPQPRARRRPRGRATRASQSPCRAFVRRRDVQPCRASDRDGASASNAHARGAVSRCCAEARNQRWRGFACRATPRSHRARASSAQALLPWRA